MWDQIEAKNDLHLFSKELPEVLRGADWENLQEDEAQAVIDGYFSAQLKGINPESQYGQQVAEGIFAQNAKLLETHRDFQIARVQQEQRVMIYNEAVGSYELDGVLDYDTVAKHTGVAFDGANKMATYWDIIYDVAIQAGDESIIDNVPERFPSGDPTGINDPSLLADHMTSKNKAIAVREKREREEASAAAARRAALRATGQLDLLTGIVDGIDPTATALEYAQNGIIKPEDVTASITAFRTMRDDRAQHGFDPNQIAILQTQSALDSSHPSLEPNSLLQAFANGIFGPPDSPEAKTAFRQMLQDVQGAKDRRSRVNADPRKKTWVNRFDESFPTPKDQFGVPVPGVLTQLRAEYSAEFEMAILAAPPEKYREIYAEYSKLYVEQEKLQSAQTSSRTPVTTLKQIVRGNFTPEQGAAHARQQGWTAQTVINMRAEGEFGDDFAAGSKEAIAYREFLLALANPQ